MSGGLSVLHLSILMHYYARCDDWDCITPTHSEYRVHLISLGLLGTNPLEGKNEPQFMVTEKGRVHVEALCKARMPQQRWVSTLQEAL